MAKGKDQGLGRVLEKRRHQLQRPVRKPFGSVLEESQVEDYVSYCAATDRQILVHNNSNNRFGLPSVNMSIELGTNLTALVEDAKGFSLLPRKPSWKDMSGSAAEYQKLEEREFYRWRAQLATLENSNSHLIMTPFERSLDIWRELWRCVERSDILFQVLDARNPLFFFCRDLFEYSRLVRPHCRHYVILNKADLLTDQQRSQWSDYFSREGLEHIFFCNVPSSSDSGHGCAKVFLPIELSEFITKSLAPEHGVAGFVGYPNVGKSSTINSLLGVSKAAVSATPGKTKHIQTFETADFTICDCPGLVFPNLALSKAELILNGVLSVDQMREYLPPAGLLTERIPLAVIEATYNIRVHLEHNVSLAESVLGAYGRSRGMFTSNFGNPDMSKASRVLLKDYFSGKLLFCYPPPGTDPKEFNAERPLMNAPQPDFSIVHDPVVTESQAAVGGIHIRTNRSLPPAGSGKKHYKMNKRR